MVSRLATLAALALLAALADPARGNGTVRYGFYRGITETRRGGVGAGTRRVYGGRGAALEEWGAACALLDRYWGTRCSASVLAARWALTAAHCISPHIAYVKYNARRPAAPAGDAAPVHCLYRHPGYKVVQEDEGRGLDVTLLHHDVGLVRTRADMRLATRAPAPTLYAMTLYDAEHLRNAEVQVLGFGRTETSPLGEELFAARLKLVTCGRAAWLHCVCGAGVAGGAKGNGGAGAGVCAGDSGGPVVYRDAQVGVTSMGPLACSADEADGGAGAGVGTSVVTALAPYLALINATMLETEAALRMEKVSSAGAPARLLASLLLVLTQLYLTFTCNNTHLA